MCTLIHDSFDPWHKITSFKIADSNIEIKATIKFLGVTLDKNKTWEDHICTVETKLAKNIDLVYHTNSVRQKKCFKSICFAYIHSYLNSANIP